MQVAAAHWALSVSGQAFAQWLTQRRVECVCTAVHDSELLSILRAQLDRCGPEHLNRIACPLVEPGWSYASMLLLLLLAWAVGVLSGAVLALRFF